MPCQANSRGTHGKRILKNLHNNAAIENYVYDALIEVTKTALIYYRALVKGCLTARLPFEESHP